MKKQMKLYFAPMEGVTGHVYRNAFHDFFRSVDQYYAPFIVANQSGKMKSREMKDILPGNNKGIILVPQILTNNAADFLKTAERLKEAGYQEVNLNLGCPSGTVVAKKKGSGLLAYQEELDAFLDEIFSVDIMDISIKTRLGKDDPDEFYELLEIYNKYPVKELTIHARVQKDMYKNTPNWKVFGDALSISKNPVCYNGDIFNVENYKKFTKTFPKAERIMMGRGFLANPGLAGEIRGEKPVDKETIHAFHDRLVEDYRVEMSGDRNVLFKMKEIWFYMSRIFTNSEKYAKKIRKAQKFQDYEDAVNHLFAEQEIKTGNVEIRL